MKAIVKSVEPDSKNPAATWGQQLIHQIQQWSRKNKIKLQSLDDTVESQAQTFRIWMWSSAAGLSIILIAAVISMRREPPGALDLKNSEAALSMVDHLPEGYMIAPIEPTNIDSLDSMFENHGYADLYRASADGSRGQRIARGLALVRAPRNPRQFAVIVSESEIDVLGLLGEPVMVVLRKSAGRKSEAKTSTSPARRKVSPFPERPPPRIDLIEEDGLENEGGVS